MLSIDLERGGGSYVSTGEIAGVVDQMVIICKSTILETAIGTS